jgi:hypothetical protein
MMNITTPKQALETGSMQTGLENASSIKALQDISQLMQSASGCRCNWQHRI